MVYSSVTPGYFELRMEEAYDSERLTTATKVSELEALAPQVFTVSEINLDGEIFNQIMGAGVSAEDKAHAVDAIYFFSDNEGTFSPQSLGILFEEVNMDFPTSGLLAFDAYLAYLNENTLEI